MTALFNDIAKRNTSFIISVISAAFQRWFHRHSANVSLVSDWPKKKNAIQYL